MTAGGRRPAERHVWVLRHAHAVDRWPGGDHARPLNAVGEREVQALGATGGAIERALGAGARRPDLVASSSAVRALATAEGAARALGLPEPQVETAFYRADADDLAAWLGMLADDVTSVMVVGHNPAVHALVELLGSPVGTGDGPAAAPSPGTAASAGLGDGGGVTVPDRFPPASLAVVVLAVEGWRSAVAGTGRLCFVAAP